VAGYPEAHPDRIVSDADEMKKNYWADIHYLKEKVSPPPPLHCTPQMDPKAGYVAYYSLLLTIIKKI
jgi:hypothetical protein